MRRKVLDNCADPPYLVGTTPLRALLAHGPDWTIGARPGVV